MNQNFIKGRHNNLLFYIQRIGINKYILTCKLLPKVTTQTVACGNLITELIYKDDAKASIGTSLWLKESKKKFTKWIVQDLKYENKKYRIIAKYQGKIRL